MSFENVSSDLLDNPFLSLRLDAASRISGILEQPEFSGTPGTAFNLEI